MSVLRLPEKRHDCHPPLLWIFSHICRKCLAVDKVHRAEAAAPGCEHNPAIYDNLARYEPLTRRAGQVGEDWKG